MTDRFDETPVFLDRLTDRMDYAVIGPIDGRTSVLNTAIMPHAAVCHVQCDFGDGRLSGCSGFLMAPRVVMTAGHCVFSRPRQLLGRRAVPARIRITPGRDGARAPFGQQWASRWYALRRFVRNADVMADVGIIVLPQPFRRVGRALGVAAPNDRQLRTIRNGRLLHIAGYPGDKPSGTMWEHGERLDRFTPRALFYSVDTCPGHSGSAVWVRPERTGPVEVIGVHVAGPRPHERGAWGCRPGVPMAPAGAVNRGIRLTKPILAAVRQAASGRSNALFIELGRAAR
jgi:V8-like Glu-specific endopeptidase